MSIVIAAVRVVYLLGIAPEEMPLDKVQSLVGSADLFFKSILCEIAGSVSAGAVVVTGGSVVSDTGAEVSGAEVVSGGGAVSFAGPSAGCTAGATKNTAIARTRRVVARVCFVMGKVPSLILYIMCYSASVSSVEFSPELSSAGTLLSSKILLIFEELSSEETVPLPEEAGTSGASCFAPGARNRNASDARISTSAVICFAIAMSFLYTYIIVFSFTG